MLINGTSSSSCPWKGNESFDSRIGRSCWHWLYHNDQERQHVLKLIPQTPPRVKANALGRCYSAFDKVYEIKWEDLIIRECIGKGIIIIIIISVSLLISSYIFYIYIFMVMHTFW